jgi:putative ABC transport system permease protein
MNSIWVTGPIAWVVLGAARLVPTPVCYRLEEEWLADLLALDGLVQKIRFALGCVWAALQMRRESITGTLSQAAQRNFIEELPAVKWIPIIWAGSRRNSGRSLLILALLVVAFALLGAVQGLTSAVNHAFASAHPDRLYVTSKIKLGVPLPIGLGDWLKRQPGVLRFAPRYQFGAMYQRPQQGVAICATDMDALLAIYPQHAVDPSQLRAMHQHRDGAIVGKGLMRKYGWAIGQRIALRSLLTRKDGTGEWSFEIIGTWGATSDDVEDDSLMIFTNYDYVNESLPSGPARDAMQFAVLQIADPARANTIQRTIDSHYANSPNTTLTLSEHNVEQSLVAPFANIDSVGHRLVGATLFVLLFATSALMMRSIRERAPELAALKAAGFSETRVSLLILGESLVLCVVGAAIGLFAGTKLLLLARTQIASVTVPHSIYGIGLAYAAALALAGGAMAAWRGTKLRVVDG